LSRTFQTGVGVTLYEAQICAQQEMEFKLRYRTTRVVEESSKILWTSTPASLGDIRTHRHGTSPDLSPESITFVVRKAPSYTIDLERQSMGLLPNHQVSEALQASFLVSRGSRKDAKIFWGIEILFLRDVSMQLGRQGTLSLTTERIAC
jgi:hypothetical protein